MEYNDGRWTPRNVSPALYGTSMMDILLRHFVARGHQVTLVIVPSTPKGK